MRTPPRRPPCSHCVPFYALNLTAERAVKRRSSVSSGLSSRYAGWSRWTRRCATASVVRGILDRAEHSSLWMPTGRIGGAPSPHISIAPGLLSGLCVLEVFVQNSSRVKMKFLLPALLVCIARTASAHHNYNVSLPSCLDALPHCAVSH